LDWLAELDAAGSITDPVERARVLTDLLAGHQAASKDLAVMRRDAIDQALGAGATGAQLAKALGVSGARISQMRRVEGPAPVITGWQLEPGEPEARIAVCGSRADGTQDIDAAVAALADLLMRRRYAVSHGPVGVGAEVLTRIADQHHPAGLDSVRGIVGHANVVKDADYVLIVGGGAGTQSEADTAAESGKRLLPMLTSGGAAAQVYVRMISDPPLRAWLPEATFQDLASANGARFAEIAETAITTGGEDA
jgi:hypothetical protein